MMYVCDGKGTIEAAFYLRTTRLLYVFHGLLKSNHFLYYGWWMERWKVNDDWWQRQIMKTRMGGG